MKTVKFSVSYEKLISRLPALFPYVEIDEWGVTNIVKATNSAQGDYGRIVADLRIDQGFDYTCSNGEEIHITAGRRSYRTLIDAYYKAIKDKKWERDANGHYTEPFLAFMEIGIGLKYVHLSEGDSGEEKCGVKLKIHYPLAPDYIYLADARRMYDEVIRMKKQIDFWDKHIKNCKEDKPQYVALKNRFEAMNGDELLRVLEGMIKEAEKVAEEYLAYNEGCPSLKFNVNLNNTIKDLGMVTPMIEEWVAGKRYYNGDVVYYVDENGYGLTWECKIDDKEVKTDDIGRKYIEGYFDEESELVYFEDGSSIFYRDEEIKIPQYWIPQSLTAVSDGESNQGGIVVKGTCDSHLTSFRRYENYMTGEEQIEFPDNFKDWLWFYRIGTIVNREEMNDSFGNLACMRMSQYEGYRGKDRTIVEPITKEIYDNEEDDVSKRLTIWGDVLSDITAHNGVDGVGVITFTYWMGVHLVGEKGNEIEVETPFTITKQYAYNNSIDIKDYQLLSKENKGKVGYRTNTDLYIAETYEKGQELSRDLFDSLLNKYKNNVLILAKEEFAVGGKEYPTGTTIPQIVYEALSDYRKDKVEIIVTKEFEFNRMVYHINDIFPSKEYYILAANDNVNNVIFKTKSSLNVDGKIYKENSLVSLDVYEKLDEANKNKVVFHVNKTFINECTIFEKDWKITLFGFEKIPFEYRTDNNFTFIVNHDFRDEGVEYKVGDTVTFEVFDKLIHARKDNFDIVLKNTLYIGGTLYKSGSIITKELYQKLSDKDKQEIVMFVQDKNGISEIRQYYSGYKLTNDEYESLSSGDKNKCKNDKLFYVADDDGNYKFYFKNLTADADSFDGDGNLIQKATPYGRNRGVKYTESYIYYESTEPDSLWDLVASGKFEDYIRGKFDKGSVEVQNEDDFKLKEKFEFITSDNIEQFTIKIGNYFKKVPFIKTSYETKVDISSVDFEKTALIRYDYYNGVQFHPTVNTDVSIERGLTQAFEKYIKFSEIKTFDDFVNYSNGGFFSISEENMDLGK